MFMDPHFPPGAMPAVDVSRVATKQRQREEAQRRAREARFAKLIDEIDRAQIGATIDLLIERLDSRDGDPDLEDDDPSGSALDRGEGASWPEWSARRAKLPYMLSGAELHLGEDGEEDDPAGGNIDDEPHDPEEDKGVEDEPHDEEADELDDPEDRAVRRPHRDRIRRTRCDRIDHPGRAGAWGCPGWSTYRLRDGSNVMAMPL